MTEGNIENPGKWVSVVCTMVSQLASGLRGSGSSQAWVIMLHPWGRPGLSILDLLDFSGLALCGTGVREQSKKLKTSPLFIGSCMNFS